MSRAAGLCVKCGGPKRGRSARTAAPIGQCESCRGDICLKHARWQGDFYLCYKCERKGKKSDINIRIELPDELDSVLATQELESQPESGEEVMPCDYPAASRLGALPQPSYADDRSYGDRFRTSRRFLLVTT
jgi:hypothetical protein